jgi:hypothetical protein
MTRWHVLGCCSGPACINLACDVLVVAGVGILLSEHKAYGRAASFTATGKRRNALFADALVGLLSRDRHDPGCAPFQSRRQTMHMKVHSELGCAPKRTDHMVSAYDAMDVPDTSMLLMLHTGRRSMKGSLFGSPREHCQQPCKRLSKTRSSCARLHQLCVDRSRLETIVGARAVTAVVTLCRESCTNEYIIRESHRPATPDRKETCWLSVQDS